MIRLIFFLYNVAWHLALPLLKRSPRVGLGWQQRTMQEAPEGPFDLWIQAASGGESILTTMVLKQLTGLLAEVEKPSDKLRILVTSGTKQGIDSLNKYNASLLSKTNISVSVSYFPFDAPSLMAKAFDHFAPRLAIIVETELWPGFLFSARKKRVPVLLVNGRMSAKSFGSYKYFKRFFKKYGPAKVLAISELDGQRFSEVMGPARVSKINNIKFDRIEPRPIIPHNIGDTPFAKLLSTDSPFILLGSIRRQEEEKILQTIIQLRERRPEVTIGLFPKHIERTDHWLQRLAKEKIKASKRSETNSQQPPGAVIIGDIFGELAGAYGLARATFVGGSLENLGGQNFLEPLVFGLKPIIGPYWKNFAWVGQEIISSNLVQQVSGVEQLVNSLLEVVDTEVDRELVIRQVQDFLQPRKGGTQQVCYHIIETLNLLEKNRI